MDNVGPASVRITSTDTGDALILTFHGAIDASTREEADRLLREITAGLPPPDLVVVVVDLTALGFIAAAGVHLLAGLTEFCATQGLSVYLVVGDDTVTRRLVHVGKLHELTPVFGGLAEALTRD